MVLVNAAFRGSEERQDLRFPVMHVSTQTVQEGVQEVLMDSSSLGCLQDSQGVIRNRQGKVNVKIYNFVM